MPLPKNKDAAAVLRASSLLENRLRRSLIAGLATVWVWSAVAPFNRFDWLLENLLVFALAAVFWVYRRRLPFSDVSYVCLTIFLSLHLIGAHYTYAETPFGFWLKDALDLNRNHYDRLIHFAFGLLWVYPTWEWLRANAKVGRRWASFLALSIVCAGSGFYEMVEAGVAMLVSPELGDAYLGTQGDIWDAQWDMSLATAGALIVVGALGARRSAAHKKPA